MSGGRTDKACLAVLEHFPKENRLFLTRLFDKLKTEDNWSADQKIHETISQYRSENCSLAFDVPLQLPKCLRCHLVCPGYEVCNEAEIKWFRDSYQVINKAKKPKKAFTPYTQRCVDSYLNFNFEIPIDVQHALGANLAPLTARALFISRRIKLPTLEVSVKHSVWRLGKALKLQKIHSKGFRNAVMGDESRRIFLQALVEQGKVFLYQQDIKIMIENHHAFEAFVCSYVSFLSANGETEPRPKGFPKQEAWVEFPKEGVF